MNTRVYPRTMISPYKYFDRTRSMLSELSRRNGEGELAALTWSEFCALCNYIFLVGSDTVASLPPLTTQPITIRIIDREDIITFRQTKFLHIIDRAIGKWRRASHDHTVLCNVPTFILSVPIKFQVDNYCITIIRGRCRKGYGFVPPK